MLHDQTFYSEATPSQKAAALRKACEKHVKLTRECSQGLGQDRWLCCPPLLLFTDVNDNHRHLYALYCLVQRQFHCYEPRPNGITSSPTSSPPSSHKFTKMPAIFTDPGWATLGTSILSTSNCGNPALRLFGFGPVAADGYGIGYIIKEDGISMYVFILF